MRDADPTKVPLFVDLDGTLIRTDLLVECLLRALRRNAAVIWRFPGWLAAGRQRFKLELARRGAPEIATLPFRDNVIKFLRNERQAGRQLVLATAATRELAVAVAEHLQLFDDVLASDERHNLKSAAKLAAIRQYCDTRGIRQFAYMGDSRADLAIWRKAAECLAVAPTASVLRELRKLNVPLQELEARRPFGLPFMRAMMPAASDR
jgi:phosphoserine phosphatase